MDGTGRAGCKQQRDALEVEAAAAERKQQPLKAL